MGADEKTARGKPLPKEEVDFVLIGAGLPRTGTMSTYCALEMVLPGKCHHMARVSTDSSGRNLKFWPKAAAGEATEGEWKEFVKAERLSAGVDYPMSLFWKDLVKMYPNAKVLLNDRDPVRWYDSVRNTILNVVTLFSNPIVAYNPLLQLLLVLTGRTAMSVVPKVVCYSPTPLGSAFPRGMFGAVEDGQEEAVRFFDAWKAKVIKEVPADRLLVWQVKQGWEPLCQFLGIPVPEQPFPNVNDTPMMQKNIRALKGMVAATWAITAAAAGAAAYWIL